MTDVNEAETAIPTTDPVSDWATDYDIFDADYIANPFPVWDDLRDECPIAKSDRWGGSWLPTKYDDVVEMARMVPVLSSRDPLVVRPPDDNPSDHGDGDSSEMNYSTVNAPPISSDPPVHTWARRLILPYFSPKATAKHEPFTRQLCHELIDAHIESGQIDGAAEYAQQIPPRVIAHLLGVDPGKADEFTEWVRGVLEVGLSNPTIRTKYRNKIREFFMAEIADRKANPGDDLISDLLKADVDGEPISDLHIAGTCNLLLVAGIDTTWSSIGAALWHLADNPDDTRRLVEDPSMLPNANEEFLRAYAPVTMARVVDEDVEVKGCPMSAGDKILMNFPGANRDPEAFEDADKVIIDRQRNRHVAFGVGIHRCAGSNLARMEMEVAIGVFLERIPEFSLTDPSAVTWAGGQVRGPRHLPISF